MNGNDNGFIEFLKGLIKGVCIVFSAVFKFLKAVGKLICRFFSSLGKKRSSKD